MAPVNIISIYILLIPCWIRTPRPPEPIYAAIEAIPILNMDALLIPVNMTGILNGMVISFKTSHLERPIPFAAITIFLSMFL